MASVGAIRSGRNELEANNETRDTLFLLGGLSLILFGAGLVVTNPAVRKLIGQNSVGRLLEGAVPDLERYLKIRAM